MTKHLDRRRFLAASAAAGAAIEMSAAAARAEGVTAQQRKVAANAPLPLPFDPAKIKGLSEKLLLSHYENNYIGAIKRLNAIAEQLAALDFDKAPGFQINGLKREELIATNSMILHEIYFAGLGDGGRPGADLARAIDRDFGEFERWRSEFVGMGKALGGGSGWVILAYDKHGKKTRQFMGQRPHPKYRWRRSAARPRYVRARLSDGFRRKGRRLCEGRDGGRRLVERRPPL